MSRRVDVLLVFAMLFVLAVCMPAVSVGQEKKGGDNAANAKADAEKKAGKDASDGKDGESGKSKNSKDKTDKNDAKTKDDSPDAGNEFGSKSKKSSKRTSGKGPSKATASLTKDELAEKRYRDSLEKSLKKQLKKDDGYYVVLTEETVFRKFDPAAPPANPKSVLPGGYVPDTTIEIQVLEGRETTMDFLLDYMSKFPPAASRSRSSRKGNKAAEQDSAPETKRDYRVDNWFKNKDDAFTRQQQLQVIQDKAHSG